MAESEELREPRPTPTQEENDLAVMGSTVSKKEHDGSAPDSGIPEVAKVADVAEVAPVVEETREVSAEEPTRKYKTRAAAAEEDK